MSNKLKKIVKYIIMYIVIIVAFLFLLFISSLIPSEYLKENVKQSAEILNEQTNKYMVKIRNWNIMFDNYTDALMINTAYSIDSKDPFYSVMMARKNYIPGVTKTIQEDTVGELKSSSKYSELDQVGELNDTINGTIEESFEYARYWHGYLVLLRPLLIFFNISNLRLLLKIVFYILGIVLFSLIWKKINLTSALIIVLGLLGVDYLHIGLSLQNAPIFLVMIIFSIYILIKNNNIKDIYMLFFIIGGVSCYVDFLTVPIITLGIPMTIYFLIKQKEETITIRETIKTIFKIVINWFCGYGIIWFSKWLMVDILYNKGLIKTALEQVMYRSEGYSVDYSFYNAVRVNIRIVGINLIISLILGMIIILKEIRNIKLDFAKVLPYIIALLLTFIWYFVLKEHSYEHCFFTYRTTVLVLINIPLICIKLVEKDIKTVNEE